MGQGIAYKVKNPVVTGLFTLYEVQVINYILRLRRALLPIVQLLGF